MGKKFISADLTRNIGSKLELLYDSQSRGKMFFVFFFQHSNSCPACTHLELTFNLNLELCITLNLEVMPNNDSIEYNRKSHIFFPFFSICFVIKLCIKLILDAEDF